MAHGLAAISRPIRGVKAATPGGRRLCQEERWTTPLVSTTRQPAVRENPGGQTERMTKHMTGTREEWLAARVELLEAEKELTRRSDELARRRQELPWVRIDKEYRFETDEGTAFLADLFRGRSQLLVYHFMFGPAGQAPPDPRKPFAGGSRQGSEHVPGHQQRLAGRDQQLEEPARDGRANNILRFLLKRKGSRS